MSGVRTPEGTGTTAASGVVTGLATLCVAVRFYTRIRTKVHLSWDDWFILIGLLLTLLTAGLLVWGLSVDPNAERIIQEVIDQRTTTTFDTSPHTTYLKLSFICSILYFSIITAIKCSILLMYHRIFAVNPAFRLQIVAMGIIVILFWLATTMATLLNCRPLQYSWIGLSLEEHCINYNVFWMVTGAVEVVIDTVILSLPVRMVLSLHLSRSGKASVLIIFLLGGFVIITGILRVVAAYARDSRIPSYSGAGLWSAIHIGMAIICACLPPIRPLLSRKEFFTSAVSSVRQRYYSLRGHDSSIDSNFGLQLRRTPDPL